VCSGPMADDMALFGVKNAYYLGCYGQAISEAMSANVTGDARVECDFFRFRACIAQGQGRLVQDEVGNDSPLALQAAKLLATYTDGSRERKDMCLMQLKEWLSDSNAMGNAFLLQVAAVVFSSEGEYGEVLKHTHQHTMLDIMYIVTHTYIAMNRLDLARKQVGLMAQQDDDATLTQLATAHVGMNEGRDKCQEALNTFQDLGEKYNMSLLLTNGSALCRMHLGQFEEAEQMLQDGLQKSATDVDTLANMVVCMSHMGKPPEQIARYTNQLRAVSPGHPWVARYNDLEASFERTVAQFNTGEELPSPE